MRKKRTLLLTLAGLALLAALAYGFRPLPTPVVVAAVTEGPFQVTIEEEGRTRVADRYVVSAPINGYLRRIGLEAGDAVEARAPVARLEPPPASALDPRTRAQVEAMVERSEAGLRAAQAQLEAAEAIAELAEAEAARARRLFEAGTIPPEQRDRAIAEELRAEADARAAAFQVEVASHELAALRLTLRIAADARAADEPPEREAARYDGDEQVIAVRAPVDGVVLRVLQQSAGVVQAGQPLLELGDVAALEVEVEVLSTDAVRLRPGMRALLDRWGGEAPLEARVRTVEPGGFTKVSALGVEEQRTLVIVDLVDPREAWEHLGDGYRVEARFILWEDDAVVQAPAAALFRRQGRDHVFVVEEGRAVRRAVEIGRRSGLQVEVREGLRPGEVVILHPPDALDEGAPVAPHDAGATEP